MPKTSFLDSNRKEEFEKILRSLSKSSWSNLTFRKKKAIIRLVLHQADEKTLELYGLSRSGTTSFHDGLFNLIMCRFSAMAPNKFCRVIIFQSSIFFSNPLLAMVALRHGLASFGSLLRRTGLFTSQPMQSKVYLLTLAIFYLSAIRVWHEDDSEDQAPTMMYVDRGLRKLDTLLKLVTN